MAEDAPLLRFKNQQLGGQVRARRDARERRARATRAGARATATAKDSRSNSSRARATARLTTMDARQLEARREEARDLERKLAAREKLRERYESVLGIVTNEWNAANAAIDALAAKACGTKGASAAKKEDGNEGAYVDPFVETIDRAGGGSVRGGGDRETETRGRRRRTGRNERDGGRTGGRHVAV